MLKSILDLWEKEATPLIRYGLVFLLSVLAVMFIADFHDLNDRAHDNLSSTQTELVALNQVEGSDIWASRRDQSESIKVIVDQRLWTGQTSGIISANAQQTLQTILKKLGAEDLLITIDPAVDQISGVDVLNYSISCRMPRGRALIDVLFDFSTYPKSIVVGKLQATNTFRGNQLSRISIDGFIPVDVNLAEKVTE